MATEARDRAFDFSGRRALVTGASRGVGRVIARALARHGADVFINYQSDDAGAAQTAEEVRAVGASATLVKANLVRPDDIRQMFEVIAASGRLDILVHNAALGSFKPTLDVKPNQWDLSMSVNARALLLCSKEAVGLMEGGSGKIVSVSSLGSRRVLPDYGVIGVSKAALESLTRYLAIELGSRGINVNAVSAGLIDGESIRRHPQYDEIVAQACRWTPAGRLATAEEIAGIVVFLCSPLASWIVGQTIVADGGIGLRL
jgi:enoyl-[acyl-carrier protein] reductase III